MNSKGELENQAPFQSQSPGQPSQAPPTYQESTALNYSNTHPTLHYPHGSGYNDQSTSTLVVSHQPMAGPAVIAPVKDHFGLAVFVIAFCFWPLGLAALLRSRDVKDALTRNDYHAATQFSEQSKKFSMYGIVVGIFIHIFVFVCVIVSVT